MINSNDLKPQNQRHRPHIYALASGKGGVGKTNIAANLAIMLAARGKRTLVVDGDLGLANVDVLFGLSPRATIEQVINRQGDLRDILLPGPGGIMIVPAASGAANLTNLPEDTVVWLRRKLQVLMSEFDYVFIDAPSGIAPNMQLVTEMADEVLLVTTPEPTAVMDAYAVAKLFHTRRPGMPMKLLVNMISDLDAGERIAAGFNEVCSHFLDRRIETFGKLPFDPHVFLAVRRQQPFALNYPKCPATYALKALSLSLLGQQKTSATAPIWEPAAVPAAAGGGAGMNRLPARDTSAWPDALAG